MASSITHNGTVTNMGESLHQINASAFVGVSHSGGTAVSGSWNYIIHDPSWKDSVAAGNYKNGYVDLKDRRLPKGFITADSNKGLVWDDNKQAYTYKGKTVDYSNVYVIDGNIGVFTNKDGSDFYKGTVFGKHNEILMTVKDDNNHFYSYWASEVTEPTATMQNYRIVEYEKDLGVLEENDNMLYRNDIKEVTMTTDTNSATIGLVRNGGLAVDGAITVTSGGGTGGSGAANDTFVTISNGTANQTFATGSKVEAVGTKDATTGLKINGEDYTIKSGSVVSVAQNAANKTTTITVDGTATTITDTDTTYTAGNGISISGENNAIAVNLKEGENNLEVTADGLALKKDLTVDSVKAGDFYMSNAGIGYGDKAYITSSGLNANDQRITNVAAGTETKDAVNFGQLDATNKKVDNLTTEVGKGWTVATDNGTATKVGAGDTVKFSGADDNIKVSNTGKDVKVELNKELTGLTSIAGTGGTINLAGDKVTINEKVTIDSTGKISGVADADPNSPTDVVNVKYLNEHAGTIAKAADVHVKEGTYKVDQKGHVAMTYVDGNGNPVAGKKLEITGIAVVYDNNGSMHSTNSGAAGTQSIALGSKATAVNDSVAIGYGASVSAEGGVALGVGSVADRANAVSVGSKDANRQIINVAAGTADTDAVNVSQLNKVSTAAKTEVKAGTNITSVEKTTGANGQDIYTVNAKDTTYTAGNGITISGENNAIAVNLKAGENNLEVTAAGLALKKDLNVDSVKAGEFYMSNAGIGYGDKAYITSSGLNANNQKITNVAAGTAETDAVNVGQLNKVSTAAKTEVKAGTNITSVDKTTGANGQDIYTVNADGTTVSGDSNVVVTAGEKDANNVTNYGVKLNKDLKGIESVSNGNASLTLSSHPIFGATAKLTNGKASVELRDSTTIINGKVQVRQDGSIGGVTAGRVDNDAVNLGQLKDVKAEAGKHSTVTDSGNITVTEGLNKDGGKEYKVALKNDIYLAGDNSDAFVNISGSNGSVWASSSVAAGKVIMDGTTATVSGLGNKTTAYGGFANGEGKAATEEQLKEISKVADNANQGWNLSTNGGEASKVAPGETVDFSGDKNINIRNDGTNVKVELNKDIDVNSVQTNVLNSKYNLSVGTANENGTVPFFVNSNGAFYAANGKLVVDKDGKVTATAGEIGNVVLQNGVYYGHSTLQDGSLLLTDDNGNHSYIDAKGAKLGKVTVAEDGKITGVAAGKISADSTDAVNGSQLNAVATEAGKHSKVVNGNNTNVEETTVDGQKVYKVNLNNNIMVGDVTGKYVSISGTNGTIEATGAIATKDRVYADKGGKLADIDVTGNTISNGDAKLALDGAAGTAGIVNGKGASVYMQDGYTVINSKVSFDQDGKISGVAAGKISADSTDAVNGSQLNAVATEAGKHSKVVNGNNTNVEETTVDGQKVYKVNLNNNIMVGDVTGKYVSISGTNGTIEATGAIATKDRVYADKGAKLADIDVTGNTISNGGATLTLGAMGGMVAELANGQGASVKLFGDTTTINGKVNVYKDGRIAGVADGVNANDAVNVSQLQKAAAASATTVSDGVNTTVTATKAEDGHVDYKVNLNKNLTGVESISNGGASLTMNGFATELANGQGASVKLFGDTTTINGKVNVYKDGRIAGVADGVNANDAVNVSQLQKAAAASATTVSDGVNTTVTATKAEDGHTDYKVNLNKDLVGIESISNGGASLTMNGFATELTNGQGASVKLFGDTTTINNAVTVYKDGRIAGVAAGINDNDAVNVGQLKEAVEAGNTDTHIKPGEYGVGADNTVNMDVVDKNGNKVDTVTIKDVAKASDVGDVNNIASDIKNQDGSHTTVVDAVNNLNNKVGDLQYSKVEKGEIEDGDSTTTAIGKLDQKLTDVAATAAKHTKVEGSSNITVTNTAKEGEAANYKVELNKDIDVDTVTANSVTTGQTVMNKDGLAVGPNTSLKADELKVDGKTYIDKNGLNANGNKITGVAEGKENTDAVNYGQLKKTNERLDGVENQVISNSNRINQLGSRVNKVGAGAAALAALHPMDFDPDDKLTFSAGYGNYGGENAAAIGAYYRPDEKVMFSVGGTVGNGENMVNAGVSFALDRTNHVSNSRTALAREVIDLRGQLAVMGAKMAKMEKAFGMLDETKTKLFPDVPANHWAYEYIAKLAGNGYIEGYPDGNFGGDRLMTRYEFAAMLYRAIENGAALEEKIIKEFEPELGRIRVDRISGEDGDRDKIERVRVNDTKGERDHYGNKLAK